MSALAALVGLTSTVADITDRLVSKQIDEEQAAAEFKAAAADFDKRMADAIAGIKADRAAADAEARKLPHAAPLPGGIAG